MTHDEVAVQLAQITTQIDTIRRSLDTYDTPGDFRAEQLLDLLEKLCEVVQQLAAK